MIYKLRVDAQLLHAKIIYGWLPHLDVDCILIANDDILSQIDVIRSMQVICPSSIKLVMKSVDDAIDVIQSGATNPYSILLLVANIEDAVKLGEALSIQQIELNHLPSQAIEPHYLKQFSVNVQSLPEDKIIRLNESYLN